MTRAFRSETARDEVRAACAPRVVDMFARATKPAVRA
jgi:hypothetical protein